MEVSNQRSVIFYGAGRQAQYLLSGKIAHSKCRIPKLEEGICFADADERKWRSSFMGLPVMHITEALEKWPDAKIYIALGFPIKYSVIGYLTDTLKVSAERILNYEPVEKYLSCEYLQGYLITEHDTLGMCFSNFGRKDTPRFALLGNTESSMKRFLNERDELIERTRDKDQQGACYGCRNLQVRYWPVDKKVKYLNVIDFKGCNINCSYCIEHQPLKIAKHPTDEFNYRGLIGYLKENSQLDEDFRCSLVAGEITVHPKKGDILSAVYPYPTSICSNGLLYDEQIAEILRRGLSYLYVSMDAGTRETFKKIKGGDIYEIVCNNLRKYAKCGPLELKYIVLPGINDNAEDANGFFELCRELSVQNVVISRDYDGWIEIDDNQLAFMVDMYSTFMEAHIPVTIPDWQYSELENRRIDEAVKQRGYDRY